jgi:SAM-dependent methyltransferase
MEKILTKITSGLAGYYRDAAAQDNAAKQVGWRDATAQERRFAALVQLLPLGEPFSVNDLGCGQGDLLSYLVDRGCKGINYTGYDVIEEMIRLAKEKHGQAGARFSKVKSASEMRSADFTVASGIFNLRTDLPDEDWLSYILDTLAHMDTKSSRGFAFNCLTTYSDAECMRQELYYADPLFIFDHCKKQFSRNVALLHDYGEFDFTVIVRK